jgi:hypothetical protein
MDHQVFFFLSTKEKSDMEGCVRLGCLNIAQWDPTFVGLQNETCCLLIDIFSLERRFIEMLDICAFKNSQK